MTAQHDPGGKVRLKLGPGVTGAAEFSPCGRYRYWLSRWWGWDAPNNFALWIGMNPSTAEAEIDDPTIRKEVHFTKAWNLQGYIKCNVMDYRATYPTQLYNAPVISDRNIPTILQVAERAHVIIAAWGALPKPLQKYAEEVARVLNHRVIMCMGKTKDGSPRHPLYLRNDSKAVIWKSPI